MSGASSLGRRLFFAAAAFIAVAIVIATLAIGFILHRFIQGQIDQRLDTQIVFLSSMIRTRADGTLFLDGNPNGPPFDRPHHGWYWQIDGDRTHLKSASLGDETLEAPPHRPPPPPRRPDAEDDRIRPAPADGAGPGGEALHYRILTVATATGPAAIVATAPRAAVMGPLREALTTLVLSLIVLSAALALGVLFQIRLGLRPLRNLRRSLAEVRAGTQSRLPEAQPAEILPLVQDLNALFDQHDANLERARRNVANLAHGLKTPLATLAVALTDREPASVATLTPLLDSIDRRIRHHLGRARMAALGASARTHLVVAPRVADIVAVLAKVHADKGLSVTLDIAAGLAVNCEPQDFDEIAGNIIENAFKWANASVAVRAMTPNAQTVDIVVEDDGPGLPPDRIEDALRPGQRLDEATPGFGFGLPIARELAELYGGAIDLSPAPGGGLRVSIRLPVALAMTRAA